MEIDKINSLSEALSAAQGEFPPIPKNKIAKGAKFSYKYADLADVIKAIQPTLTKYGLAHSQPFRKTEAGDFLITSLLWKEQEFQSQMPIYGLERLNDQDIGKKITYMRRYALCAVLGVVADEDTDGIQKQETSISTVKAKNSPVLDQLEQEKKKLQNHTPSFFQGEDPDISCKNFVYEVGKSDVEWYGKRLCDIEDKTLFKIKAFLDGRLKNIGLNDKEKDTLYMVTKYLEEFKENNR